MVLVIDVGNTNMKFGLFDGESLVKSWRVSASKSRTADELGLMMGNLFGSDFDLSLSIEGAIMSSVQPAINYTVEHACEYFIKKKPIQVSAYINTGLEFLYKNPKELGADRIANAVGAVNRYGMPCIIVDCGTAITFSAVNKSGEFVGGAIAPGIKASVDGLTNAASKLPNIELIKPKNIIGTTTIANMQSGIINGFTGMVNHIVGLIKAEPDFVDATVVATGGLSELIGFDEKYKVITDRALSLYGLKKIYDLNEKIG